MNTKLIAITFFFLSFSVYADDKKAISKDGAQKAIQGRNLEELTEKDIANINDKKVAAAIRKFQKGTLTQEDVDQIEDEAIRSIFEKELKETQVGLIAEDLRRTLTEEDIRAISNPIIRETIQKLDAADNRTVAGIIRDQELVALMAEEDALFERPDIKCLSRRCEFWGNLSSAALSDKVTLIWSPPLEDYIKELDKDIEIYGKLLDQSLFNLNSRTMPINFKKFNTWLNKNAKEASNGSNKVKPIAYLMQLILEEKDEKTRDFLLAKLIKGYKQYYDALKSYSQAQVLKEAEKEAARKFAQTLYATKQNAPGATKLQIQTHNLEIDAELEEEINRIDNNVINYIHVPLSSSYPMFIEEYNDHKKKEDISYQDFLTLKAKQAAEDILLIKGFIIEYANKIAPLPDGANSYLGAVQLSDLEHGLNSVQSTVEPVSTGFIGDGSTDEESEVGDGHNSGVPQQPNGDG